ncbi:MucB/RseB C-terminal domain-containing protein [Thiolapillus brandeum]|uniref:Sigma-E factor negative regulatory protein RseB n=1 Tax=Thiolapillus brandeum TaxID=1076588 RepID=A0A7U6GI31_9GAMM|nr:MucB/RseB C-terminal domain-containing protein [Thiolapillus brandeum]BAO44051.1 sigma-E factor negative regulatory protein RseB [Thiolapillus brandeum]
MKGLLLLLLSFSGVVAAATEQSSHNEAIQWLERMNQAVLSVNYEGHFVYQCGGTLEAMYIRHQNGEQGSRESLSSLTGLPREVIRDSRSITVITNRNGKLQVSQQPAVGRLSPLKSLQLGELEKNYDLRMGSTTRVAGRTGVAVLLLPRDDLRYGYRLVLDKMSALPLDLTVVDSRNEVQSHIMFTDLRITDVDLASIQQSGSQSPPDQQTTVSVTLAGLEAKDSTAKIPHKQPLQDVSQPESSWQFEAVPKGFRLINHQRLSRNGLYHFVFSDGLATVSVYLEPIGKGEHAFEGFTTLGSMNVLGRRFDQYQLTVVGEVPSRTLELLASGIKPHHS